MNPDEVLDCVAPPAKEAFLRRCEREGITPREAIKTALYQYAIEQIVHEVPELFK